MNFWKALKDLRPVRRKTYDEKVHNMRVMREAMLSAERSSLAKERELLNTWIDRLSRLKWTKKNDWVYRITFEFEPGMLCSGMNPQREIEFIAKSFAQRVEYEITRSKFLEKSGS